MELREELIKALIAAKIPSPRLETDIILKNYAPDYPQVSAAEEKNIRKALSRRLAHEPLDKIIEKKEFYKSTFKVTRDVLSPRPDTEIIVESALELIPENKSVRILDLGTGSGCILLSLLKERPMAFGVGLDISEKALAVAKENATALAVQNRVQFINQSWNDMDSDIGKFDIIVSNPPYIAKEEIAALDTEVKDFDPMLALDGGNDGLQCYREIASITNKLLQNNGYILLEVGYNQSLAVREIFQNQGFAFVKTVKDLAGIGRCVILKV